MTPSCPSRAPSEVPSKAPSDPPAAARAAVPLAVAALLLLAAVPLPAAAQTEGPVATASKLDYVRTGLAGDTYVLKLNSNQTGQPFTIQAGSRISVDALYPAFREDFAIAFAFTDLVTTAGESLFYGTFQTSPGLRLELLSDTFGPEVEVVPDSSTGSTGGIGWDVIFTSSFAFPDRDWYLAVSTPEAVLFDVHVNLTLDTKVDLLAEGTAGAGLVASTDDFDGTAQVEMNQHTVALDVEARGQAPAGTRAFAVLLPMFSRGAGSYGVNGPGGNDDRVTIITTTGNGPPPAFVLAGPPGTYRHFVSFEAWQHTQRPDGRAAVFFAAPMPL